MPHAGGGGGAGVGGTGVGGTVGAGGSDAAAALLDRPDAKPLVALIGPPNSGKTTLFNQLTGLRQKVANYPGVTVEKHIGEVRLGREPDDGP